MEYDLVIIGAGWAGFNAAQRAKELGLKVAIIDKGQLGGTCLNRGCIPTKSLVQSAKIYSLAKKSKTFGVEISDAKVNFTEIQARKDRIIQQLRQGMQFMLKGIDFINAEASIISNEEIAAAGKSIRTKFILIATGSKPIELRGLEFDGKKIISSDELLSLKEIPKSLLIIGGGVIGCEFASLFSAFGTQVSVVEKMPQLLPGEDKDVAKKLETTFKKKGIKISTNTDAQSIDLKDYDLALLCVGRAADTPSLELDRLGLRTDRGKVIVDDYLKTDISNIYAAGDCTGEIMLAHFAAYQGTVAAENIANPSYPKKASNLNVPNCIFTDPEISSVGLNQDAAENKGIGIKINKFDFLASSMGRILDETEGFVKIVSDKNTDGVLGASIIGPKATELIGILTVAVSCHLKVSQIRDTIFAHPTVSESITEALRTSHEI